MDTIESRSNQTYKYARKVRDGKIPNAFFVEGKRLAEELMNSPVTVETLFFTPAFARDHAAETERLSGLAPQVFVLSDSLLSSLAETKSPQGVAAVCLRPADGRKRLESNLNKSENAVVILLHHISNPGNLGAIIRSAEAFHAAGVIVTNGSADPFSAKAVRGSMGSAFRLPIWMGIDFEEAIEWADHCGVRTICADTEAAASVSEIKWGVRSMLVFGSEAHGLSQSERRLIKEYFSVPMSEMVESLNISVAASIAIYVATKGDAGR